MTNNQYQRALIQDMIAALKQHVKDWRHYGANDGNEHMHDLETWVHEIWGDEE